MEESEDEDGIGMVGSLTAVHWSDEWMNGYMRVQKKMVGLVGSLTVVHWSDKWMNVWMRV